MTEQAQRIAIAEKLGWTVVHSSEKSDFATPDSTVWHLRHNDNLACCFSWTTFKGKIGNPILANCANELPNYPTDLNACHEMENGLNDVECRKFAMALHEITNAGDTFGRGLNYFRISHATARQRCEAFLRTFGLWKEGE